MQSITWPEPPESAKYRMTFRRLRQTRKNSSGFANYKSIVRKRLLTFGARSNTTINTRAFSRSSIIAHIFENPWTGGGKGPTNATCLVIARLQRSARIRREFGTQRGSE